VHINDEETWPTVWKEQVRAASVTVICTRTSPRRQEPLWVSQYGLLPAWISGTSRDFTFSPASTPTVRPTQHPFRWISVNVSPEQSGWDVKLTTHIHLMARLRMPCILMAYLITFRSRGSSVSTVSGYGLDDRAIEVRSPAGAKDFSSILCVQTSPTQPPVQWAPGVLSPGVKARPRRDAEHSPPSSAEVENE
jgi:hypothetical protein